MLAILAPGQGSQKPGFLTPWLDVSGVESQLLWWSTLAGIDLIRLGTVADADEIKDTAKTQPLLVAAALMAAHRLPVQDTTVVAGHSVGELGAAAIAGILSPEAAVTLAGLRGREMAAACAHEPTGMAAVLGGEPTEVLAAIETTGLYPANHNGPGQIVAAGPVAGIDKLVADPPGKARVMRLAVAGAFHTPHMSPAERALATVAPGITVSPAPTTLLLSNLDGTAVTTGQELINRLVRQVTAPVRWDLCMATMADLGVTGIIELPPAGILAGLVKRSIKGVEVVTVNTPDDLSAAHDLISRYAGPSTHEPAPQMHIAVSNAAGDFLPAAGAIEGTEVRRGQVIGHVRTRQGDVDVTAHAPGTMIEWLVQPADPVSKGQPIARMHPEGGPV